MQEIFKTIPSFPDYEVSNFGRVKTKKRKLRYTHSVTKKEHFRESTERFLKIQYSNITGYKFHQLYKDKKMYNKTVHSLVADAFLVKGDNEVVNHIDGNKHNNCVDNLEWCTIAYNHEHAVKTGLMPKGWQVKNSKLNDNMVHAIKWFLSKGYSHVDLAKAFKMARSSISLIHENKTWKHITLD